MIKRGAAGKVLGVALEFSNRWQESLFSFEKSTATHSKEYNVID